MEIKMRINIERSPARRVPVTYPLNLSALKSVTGHHGDRPIKSWSGQDTRALSTKITAHKLDDDGENTFRAGTLVEASGCRVPGRVVLLFPSYIKGEREILFKRNYSNNSSDEARLFLSFKSIVRICFPRFINQGTISIEQKYPCRTTNLLCNRTIALCLLRTIRFFANITIRVAIFHDPSCFSSDTAHPIHVIVYEEQFKRRGSDSPLLPPLHSASVAISKTLLNNRMGYEWVCLGRADGWARARRRKAAWASRRMQITRTRFRRYILIPLPAKRTAASRHSVSRKDSPV